MSEFKSLSWLNVDKRVQYLALNHMYKIYNGTAPSYLCDIDLVSQPHNTRGSKLAYVVPRVNSKGAQSFKFNAVKLWNHLPHNIKSVENSSTLFKQKCKVFCLSQQEQDAANIFVKL